MIWMNRIWVYWSFGKLIKIKWSLGIVKDLLLDATVELMAIEWYLVSKSRNLLIYLYDKFGDGNLVILHENKIWFVLNCTKCKGMSLKGPN